MKPNHTLAEIGNIAFAFAFIVLAAALGYRYIGLPPLIIVGGSGLIGLLAWSATYLKRPTSPEIILPCFLLTVAALEIHMMEEFLTGFGPAMSRLFNITWTERGFLIVFAFVGPALYALTARKGTATARTLPVMERVEEGFYSQRVLSGLSSGEGLIKGISPNAGELQADGVRRYLALLPEEQRG